MLHPQHVGKCLNTATFSILISLATHAYIKLYRSAGVGYGTDILVTGWWSQLNENPSHFPSTSNTPHLRFSTYPQIAQWMNLIELLCVIIWAALQKALKYFQGFDRNYEAYTEQKVAHRLSFWLQFGRPCPTYCLNSKLVFISYFTLLRGLCISVSLQRWQADTDWPTNTHCNDDTRAALSWKQSRVPIFK